MSSGSARSGARDPHAVDAAAYAALLARFAHRFADRAGVLEARGLDESSLARLERDVLGRLETAAHAGSPGPLLAFAQALVAARLALVAELAPGEDEDAQDPVTVAAPASEERNVMFDPPTVSTASIIAPTSPTSPAAETVDTPEPEVDVLDLMETLHSTGPGRPPRSI